MANYKDLMPTQKGWIHELARAEVHPEAEKLLSLGKSFDPQQLVEESTIENHIAAIFTKLDFHRRSQIAVWAVDRGLYKPEQSAQK